MLEGNPALPQGLDSQVEELPFPMENWVMSRRASVVNTIQAVEKRVRARTEAGIGWGMGVQDF